MNETDVNELESNYKALKERADEAAEKIDRLLTSGDGVGAALDIASTLQYLKFADVLLEVLRAEPYATVPSVIKALRKQLDEAEMQLSNSLAKAARRV